MCGVNGIVSKRSISDLSLRIQKMNCSIQHRGPDAEGCELLNNNKIAFGHRRLSIIDLENRSNQPMWSSNHQSMIVFNGEIYNYRQLKADINFNFVTNSDTEVLLAGLEINGMEFIKKCNGMFSFAFYNQNTNQIILGRDRFGIKPLYYYKDDDIIVFSSEIKGILNSGLVESKFNQNAIDEYLGNRYVREPYTFFENIYHVPAGTIIIIDQYLNLNSYRYWDLPQSFNMDEKYDEESLFINFKYEVEKAIKKRMIADVSLGTYLSGGIDSSIISAICALNSEKAVNTYTIGFSEQNEFEYAKMVADQYNTKHHAILIDDKDYFGVMKEIISYKDAPLGVPNEVALAIMSKELKKKITVVLSGEGADELLGGYGRIFRAPFDYSNSNQPDTFYEYFIKRYEYVPRDIRDKYLVSSTYYRNEFDEKVRNEFQQNSNEENIFKFFHNYHIKGLLQRVDITTMYASVEARVPFLDHELVEFAYKNIPYDLKLKWKTKASKQEAIKQEATEYSEKLDSPKYFLRRMGRELLPSCVVDRKKMGFPVPLNIWYGNLCNIAEEILLKATWINSSKIKELTEDCKKNPRAGQLLWMFINVEMFRHMYFDKEWRY